MNDGERFTSVQGFAELTALSERTIWNLIRIRKIRAYRVGRRTLIRLPDGFRAIERIDESASTSADPEARVK